MYHKDHLLNELVTLSRLLNWYHFKLYLKNFR